MGGYRTSDLSGEDTPAEREQAVKLQESSDPENCLDYIFSVDIFNKGVDIPRINQVVVLRPTESPIIFVQQLGRGLCKFEDKDYVVVIDFIANYATNYLIPLAFSRERNYSKEALRCYMHAGSRLIAGASTVSFDEISREHIYESLDCANFSLVSLIRRNYLGLKQKLGRIPRLMDFETFGGHGCLLHPAQLEPALLS